MNKLFYFVISVYLVTAIAPSSAFAVDAKDHHAAAVEFRACNFLEGKSMADLEAVNEKFRQYANKNDFDYSAWTLTPQFHNDTEFDVGWLGAWPDGGAFGVSMEKWQSTPAGRALQAEFNKVINCSGRHELAASLPINAADGTPKDGVVMFYQCKLKEGKTLADAYAAHLEAGTAMNAMGSLALSWFFQPALGAGNIDFDYYHVVAFYRYSDMGATMEMFANGGGREKQSSILSPVAACATPTVFDVLSVRAADER
ncbi:MAG: hypothetical protein R3E64_11925 [Halioglobus sp.]